MNKFLPYKYFIRPFSYRYPHPYRITTRKNPGCHYHSVMSSQLMTMTDKPIRTLFHSFIKNQPRILGVFLFI